MSDRNVSKIIAVTLLFYLSLSWIAMAPMNIAEWIYLMTLGVCVAINRKWTGTEHDRGYFRVTLLMSGAFLLSVATYAFFPLVIVGKTADSQVFRAVLKQIYFFLPLAIAAGLRIVSSEDLKKFSKIAFWIFCALSVMTIQQHWTGFPNHQGIPGVDGRYHATGFLNHHLTIVSVWIFPTFFILNIDHSTRSKCVGFLGLVVVALAYSRMAWIATLVGLALYLFLVSKNRIQKILLTFGFIAAVLGLYQLPSVQERIHQTIGVFDRMDLWRVHWELFKMKPWFGVGLLQSQEYSGILQLAQLTKSEVFSGHAHNVILEILSSSGIVGLLGFLFWFGSVSLILVRNRQLPGVTGLLCAWVVFHLNGLTQVNFFEGKVMHQLAWATGVLLFLIGGAREKAPR